MLVIAEGRQGILPEMGKACSQISQEETTHGN
jgi:hypothetical protein